MASLMKGMDVVKPRERFGDGADILLKRRKGKSGY